MLAHQSGQKATQCGPSHMCAYGHPPPSLPPGREEATVVWNLLEVALLAPLKLCSLSSCAVGGFCRHMWTHVTIPYWAGAPLTRAKPWVSYHPMDRIKALGTWPFPANEDLFQAELDGKRQRSSLRSPRSGTVNPNPVRTLYVPRIYSKCPHVGNDTLL